MVFACICLSVAGGEGSFLECLQRRSMLAMFCVKARSCGCVWARVVLSAAAEPCHDVVAPTQCSNDALDGVKIVRVMLRLCLLRVKSGLRDRKDIPDFAV